MIVIIIIIFITKSTISLNLIAMQHLYFSYGRSLQGQHFLTVSVCLTQECIHEDNLMLSKMDPNKEATVYR